VSSLASLRLAYARRTLALGGVEDRALQRAFAAVPREDFVGPPPWRLVADVDFGSETTDDPARLYGDALVSLAPARGINNGQPSLHAQCLAAVHPVPGERVLHIGAGTGYYTAILAELVGPAGAVVAYEIEPDLAALAARALAGRPQATVRADSATVGVMPVSDVIYVNAGVSDLPESWLDALAPGGRMVLPFTADGGVGAMLVIAHDRPGHYRAHFFDRVAFIDCVGARDAQQAADLAQALNSRSLGAVRSLRRHGVPDASCWLAGRGWWLSTAA
jgi:protein-L-isoaspartate(D-aspartate) O-methyltransferase